ncbi:MAG: HEAT repeat domain-containing protein [Nitrospirales bacterium]
MRIFPFLPTPVTLMSACCLFASIGCVIETTPESPARITQKLIHLLQDPQPDTRRTAALSLGKISDPQGIPALVSALSDPDEEVRQFSAWALGNLADSLSNDALVSLVQHVADPSDDVREAVVLALSQTQMSEELLQVLGEAYTISTHATQLTIIQTLAQFEFPFSYTLYIQALKSQDPLVRQTAIAGLGELGDPRGLLVMRTHLLQDSNVGVRSEAAFRLGKLGGPEDIPALRQARDTDRTPNVHFWATWSLAQINEEI